MNIYSVSDNLVKYIKAIVDKLGNDIPAVRFFKPVVIRVIDNKVQNLNSILSLLSIESKSSFVNLTTQLPVGVPGMFILVSPP